MSGRIASVIVNYNAGDAILTCLRTLLADGPDETVVVDNASADGSADRVEETFPDVRLIRNGDNIGFGPAANQGIRATAAPYVFVVNPDTEIRPGSLRALQETLDTHPRAAAVGALVLNPDGSRQPTSRAFPSLWQSALHGLVGLFWPGNPGTRAYTLAEASLEQPRTVGWVAATAVALRREAFEAVGGFDERFFFFVEDVDLCRRLWDAGWEVWFDPRAVVVHAWGLSWTQRPVRYLWMHQRMIFRYVRKHRRGAWVLAYPVIGAGLIARFVLLVLRWALTRRSVPGHRGSREKEAAR